MRLRLLPLLALLAPLGLLGCPKPAPQTTPDAGGVAPPDQCNNPDQSRANAECQLTLDQEAKGFIYPAGDRDWWHITLPAQLPPRPVLYIKAGIDAPSSPVTLGVTVLKGDGSSALGQAIDAKPRGAPSPVQMAIRLDGVSGDLFVQLFDDPSDNDDPQHSDADGRHPYTLTASVQSDPDANEPNDTQATATPLPLDGNGTGSISGFIATTGDVDYYVLDLQPSFNRPVLYLDLKVPGVTPPVQSRLFYSLYPQETPASPIAQSNTNSVIGDQDISTARLLPGPGKYIVAVSGFKPQITDPTPPGDVRLAYTLSVKLVQDLDTNEPNDTPQTGTVVNLGGQGQTVTVTGRIGFIPDQDWYVLNIPAQAQNARLQFSYKFLDSAANNARFPPIDYDPQHSISDRVMSVVRIDTSAGACLSTCPGSAEVNNDFCTRTTPQCAYSIRRQTPDYADLGNFVGMLPLKAGAATQLAVEFSDEGTNGADDRTYELDFTILPEASDEIGGYQDTAAQAPTLAATVQSSYAADPGGVAAATGKISYGILPRSDDSSRADNVSLIPQNTVGDYDALNDTDLFHYTLPSFALYADGGAPPGALGDGGVPDLSWSLAWSVPPGPSQGAGERPYDVFITAFFCDPTENAGCSPNGQWHAAPLGYKSGELHGWTGGALQKVYDFDKNAGNFLARPNQCLCIENRFVAGGQFYLAVSGVDRAKFEESTYSVRTAVGPYPQGYTDPAGAAQTCPAECHECSGANGECPTLDVLPQPTP